MEQRIQQRFNEQTLATAAARYGVSAAETQRLASAESYIYAFERDGQPRILRIGHSIRRTVALIQGEVDWLNHLAAGGAAVADAVLSEEGKLVELIDDGHGAHFLATAFVKAPGRPPTAQDATPSFIERYGESIGRMHRLTKEYVLPNPAWQRPHWDSPEMTDIADALPEGEATARDKLYTLTEQLRVLPRPDDAYGLVHQDAHGGNYFVDKSVDETGKFTFFDFDDCCYTWFANDVAIVLFYAMTNKPEASEYAAYFLPHFLRGYGRENRFDEQWFARIVDFLKLRELQLYGYIHRDFDVGNIDHPWVSSFMNGRKERIEGDVPYVEMDFVSLRWQ